MMMVMMMIMMRMMTSTSPSVVHSRLVGEWLIGSYPAQGPETRRQEILIVIIVITIVTTIKFMINNIWHKEQKLAVKKSLLSSSSPLSNS